VPKGEFKRLICGVIEDEHYGAFETAAARAISEQPAGVMLTPKIAQGYIETVKQWQALGAKVVAQGQVADWSHHACAYLFSVGIASFKGNELIREEVSGSGALIVRCKNFAEQQAFIGGIKGQLTGTIHGTEADLAASCPFIGT